MEERRALWRCGCAQVVLQHRSSGTGPGQLDKERSRPRHRILARTETAVDENACCPQRAAARPYQLHLSRRSHSRPAQCADILGYRRSVVATTRRSVAADFGGANGFPETEAAVRHEEEHL